MACQERGYTYVVSNAGSVRSSGSMRNVSAVWVATIEGSECVFHRRGGLGVERMARFLDIIVCDSYSMYIGGIQRTSETALIVGL